MFLAYFLTRDALRFLFRPSLPLLIPIQIALAVIIGAAVIVALYLTGIFFAVRWTWRALR